MVNSVKYLLTAISFISCIIIVCEYIRAYRRQEYNPIFFRLRQGYEWKPINMIAYFGMVMPISQFAIYFPKSYIYTGIWGSCLILILMITQTILHLKCYSKSRRKRILIETVITDILFLIPVIYTKKYLIN